MLEFFSRNGIKKYLETKFDSSFIKCKLEVYEIGCVNILVYVKASSYLADILTSDQSVEEALEEIKPIGVQMDIEVVKL